MSLSRPVRRREDARLLTGRGVFTDDIDLPGQAHAVFVRSSYAHGHLRGIDAAAARAAPGVLGIFTAADLQAAGIGPIPYLPMPGFRMPTPVEAPRPAFAADRVRHVGEPIAVVVAETRAQAEDAAELVLAEIEPLPAVVDTAAAVEPGAPRVWDAAPENVGLTWQGGDAEATAAAFARAAHVTRLRLVNNRVIANPIEPRTAIASFDAATEAWSLTCASQGVRYMLRVLCEHTFKVPQERMLVFTHDVGGAFGVKEQPYPEDVAILHAARALGRPVKWRGTRAEHLLSDNHGRDAVMEAELALDGEGNFLAVRLHVLDAMGAYYSVHGPYVTIRNTTNGLPLVYRTPCIDVTVKLVFTNTASTGPYRGAGREAAALVMESLVDAAARETGRDPIALRRRNLIPASAMPYRNPAGRLYDSGDFDAVLAKALALADWDGFAAREAASRAAGRLRGRGICCFLECVGGLLYESATIRFPEEGGIDLVVATQSSGQGHETSFAQLVGDRLGIPAEAIRLRQGDSRDVPRGLASIASRSLIMAGSALSLGCAEVVRKGRLLAAHRLEVAEADVVFEAGEFRVVGTDRAVALLDLARWRREAPVLPGDLPETLDSTGDFDAEDLNFPNGCHIVEIEIDPETGQLRVDRYLAVDDVGVVINPAIVHGQVQGGVAQGLGQALTERIVYDADGQMLSGSFMDYAMPRAADLPSMAVALHEVPARSNPLGVKGAGESGVTGSLAAMSNAITDALWRVGVTARVELPATPERIWRALNGEGQP
ncbi:xanthine dehydrogenase family protein molybdopterin-binding subunit [Roseomonas stagni]|uniref:Xanthine dehydrogenase family protein molybdopterin-binding subunit n=1 Tax=Falsiroseomonas algicola TaxID=2716930 RepID=A0A6M1LR83_9PROT|nr:xanthine dehydrogenase family protein molybdopterin-binding subunit [Falsiroseomonas algicola]NGM22522.1 xanthine dehydrogenase family protein molybdopterin-binding subunit [Falsiroseomonas algicola]